MTTARAPRPFHVMAKPIGPLCNLDCAYCFYLEKSALYPGAKARMAPDVLENFIRQYIEAQPGDSASFAWQGGEPTLLGLPFFRRVVELQAKHANGKTIENALQTNGTLIDDDWAYFLHEYDFLVGVSIDGPRELHDAYRSDVGGGPSFDRVMRGIEALQRRGVRFNTLTCLNRLTAKKPLEIYRFLKGIGSSFIQFIPIVERRPGAAARGAGLDLAAPGDAAEDGDPLRVFGWSVSPDDFGHFLCVVFDKWLRKDVGEVFVQMFEETLGKWLGAPGGLCVHAETCGDALAMERGGDVYSCDHFVYPEFKLGNIRDASLAEMLESPRQRAFGQAKRDALSSRCRACQFRFACNGGCPKHRFAFGPDGEPGHNYLCAGYLRYFRHVAPAMRILAELHRRGRPASDITPLAAQKRIPGYKPLR